ncbi:MAG: cytochrome b/b6 domain-containing protein [Flavobacteriaceae bacterium]|jgi:cytochrome b561|nr:cytochrome b/b6 domain-containing protein [Flavobacteriaceae bacterium]
MSRSTHFTKTHRLLHWLAAMAMGVLFITGFLRMTWMAKKTVVKTIETQLPEANLEKEEMVGIAKSLLKPMWEYHEIAAYVMLWLLAIRIVYMAIKGIRFPNPFASRISTKERLQGMIYVLFYIFVSMATITGFYLMWGDGTYKEPMEAIHKWGLYWFPIFIFLHFAGIVIGELTSKKGIVSKMIGGE